MFFAVPLVVAVVPAVLTAGSATAAVRLPAVPAVRAGTAVPAASTWGKLVNLTGTGLNSGGSAAVSAVSCPSAGNCSAGGYYATLTGGQAMVVSEISGTWGTAKELPGSGTLNKGGDAQVTAVSCPSAGNCGAAGSYRDASSHFQSFVDTQVSGKWGTAKPVPGLATLNAGNTAIVNSVSCPSAGNCSAGGYYKDGSGQFQAFVVSEVSRTWGTAAEVPGTAGLNAGGHANVLSVSCASAGNCTAGGVYRDASAHEQAFVVSEKNGAWRTAMRVPGTAALNAGGAAQVLSVSCVSAGNCGVSGFYSDASFRIQAFVASQKNGAWGSPQEIPGTATLNTGSFAQALTVSCASVGNCTAGGVYRDASSGQHAFVVSEKGGIWGTAVQLPGSAALNAGNLASVVSIACRSAGNCSAGGFYADSHNRQQPMVASQVNGIWGAAKLVPGAAALTGSSGDGQVGWVSCGSAGNCSAGGSYYDPAGYQQAFVASQVSGKWGKGHEVPGTGVLNEGGEAETNSVACRSAGNCSAGGYYNDGLGFQAFVASEVSGKWSATAEVPGTAALNKGGNAAVEAVACGSAGNCAAGGYYQDGSGHDQAFVASEVNGTWATAKEVPGTASLDVRGGAEVASLSCASAGNCGAGGYFTDASGHFQVFVVSEVNGTWGTAVEIPGTGALNAGGNAAVRSLSCGSAGNCSAVGYYVDGSGHRQAFVVTQVNGTWGTAIEAHGMAALNAGGFASVESVSCGSAGTCGAGGYYKDGSGHAQAFVISRAGGTWHTAVEVPGMAALNAGGNASIQSVSCASAGSCGAGGIYVDGAASGQAFVVNQVNGTWGSARTIPASALAPGAGGAIYALSCGSTGNCTAIGPYTTGTISGVMSASETNGTWGAAVALPGATDITALSCAPTGPCTAGGDYQPSGGDFQAFAVTRS